MLDKYEKIGAGCRHGAGGERGGSAVCTDPPPAAPLLFKEAGTLFADN